MYKKGDLVTVKMHPSFGFELRKYRPGLVLFTPVDPRFITVLPLSTKSRAITKPHEYGLSDKRLKSESWVLSWHPLTVDIKRITGRIGRLDKPERVKAFRPLIALIK